MDPRRQSHQEGGSGVEAVAGRGFSGRLLVSLLIILTLCGIVFFGVKAVNATTGDHAVNGKEYQALFLTSGQVYFGKLSKVNNDYVKLTNIYYLQVTSAGSQTTVQPGQSSANQQVSLAKLGNELHGPEDVMYVARDQVLFWENLKSSGKVVQAITNYQSTNK